MKIRSQSLGWFVLFCISHFTFAQSFDDIQFHGFNPSDKKAQIGLNHLFNGDGFHYAVPESTLGYMQAVIPYKTVEEQFKAFGRLPSPPSRKNAKKGQPLSLSIFKRKDVHGDAYSFVNANCFQCHAGVADGKIIAGLGNPHVDQASLGYLVGKIAQYTDYGMYRFAQPNLSDLEIYNLLEFANDAKIRVLPTYNQARSRGENFGPLAIWFLINSFEAPDTNGLESRPYGEPSNFNALFYDDYGRAKKLPPIDPNPWWLYKYKQSIYRYRDMVKEENRPAHFAINFTSIHEQVNQNHPGHVEEVSHILDFVKQTSSPIYPKKLNAKKVEQGRALFHGESTPQAGEAMKCYKCHGRYLKHKKFPDFSKAGGWWVQYTDKLKDAKTDTAYNETLQSYAPLIKHMKSVKEYEEFKDKPKLIPVSSVPEEPGYLPPPLDGVWASAPYFHNGSVPTLEAVLNSKARPTYWQRSNSDPYAYDHQATGMAYKKLSAYQYTEKHALTRFSATISDFSLNFRAIYNTNLYGRGNGGHDYGDELTYIERFAIIEFLKSLSGPDMFVHPDSHKDNNCCSDDKQCKPKVEKKKTSCCGGCK